MSEFIKVLCDAMDKCQIGTINVIVEAFNFDKADRDGVKYREETIGGVRVIYPVKGGVSTDPDVINDPDKTIIINQADLGNHGSFCEHNTAIRKFASMNAENMFYVLGIALATQGLAWDEFRQIYPVYAAYIRWSDGDLVGIKSFIGLNGVKYNASKFMQKGVSSGMLSLWEKRHLIYHDIYENGLIDDEFELFAYISRNISGLGTIKSGFAVQLLNGQYGCIDNINADIYGIPVTIGQASIQRKDGKITGRSIGWRASAWNAASRRVKDNTEIDSSFMTPDGKRALTDYIEFLQVIGKINAEGSVSRLLWDDWVSLASAKTLYAGSHQQIAVVPRHGGEIVVMPTYKNTQDRKDSGWDDELRNARTENDPYAGHKIGADHLRMPEISGKIDDARSRIITQPFTDKQMSDIKNKMEGGKYDKFRGRAR